MTPESESESESYVTTDGQAASLSWSKAPIWGLRPDLYYLCDSYGLVLVGRPLWREVGSVFWMCCWPLPAQSFSGPSPLGLATIFYCLRFETSLFVASYDSQVTVEVFDPASTRVIPYDPSNELFFLTILQRTRRKHSFSIVGKVCYTAPLHNNGIYSIVACVFVAAGMCLPSRCLAMKVYSDFAIPAFGRHVTIVINNIICKHPVALIQLFTGYTSVHNATYFFLLLLFTFTCFGRIWPSSAVLLPKTLSLCGISYLFYHIWMRYILI
jgi:hypothetical protein